jgi:hypothetical protein
VSRPAASAAVEAFVKAALPRPPAPPPASSGISADVLARRIDEFLTTRGYRAPVAPAPKGDLAPSVEPQPRSESYRDSSTEPKPAVEEKPTDFVCEEDVRLAIRQSRKIVIAERTIVTPAARDLGEQHRIFVQAEWPR